MQQSPPKYALARKGSGQREPLWDEYQIELIEFEDFGRPFTEAANALLLKRRTALRRS